MAGVGHGLGLDARALCSGRTNVRPTRNAHVAISVNLPRDHLALGPVSSSFLGAALRADRMGQLARIVRARANHLGARAVRRGAKIWGIQRRATEMVAHYTGGESG